MTFAKILSCALLLIVPALITLMSRRCTNAAEQYGHPHGYRSAAALSSEHAWKFAQKKASLLYSICTVLSAIAGIGFALCLPAPDLISLIICTGIAFGLEVVIVLFFMTAIELSVQGFSKK
ncbi:MAG: SdpI family protein [Clostridia bacterium]|nr:SdpI family protein [Clostridia bacterium]MBQ6858100.1 SdpI family protein [Clostridia bacterium]MBQ7053253.1 SdpI family protein [Clostridia bacterium]